MIPVTLFAYKKVALLICVMAYVSPTYSQLVRLRGTAEVEHDQILLLDLLSDDAPTAIKAAASHIAIGAAPNRGSIRVITANQISTLLDAYPGLQQKLIVPDRIDVERKGFALDPASIAATLHNFLRSNGQGDIAGESIALNSKIIASTPTPTFSVSKILRYPASDRAFILMHCKGPRSCPNLMVAIQLREGLPQFNKNIVPKDRHSGSEAVPLIQAGAKASLALEGDGIRVSLGVRCLESGSLGQTIRVWDAEHHRMFRAEVTGSHELRVVLRS
jgi:hypothetical protein